MQNFDLKERLKNYLIIDSHVHLGPLSYLYIPSGSNENIIELLKEFCIKKAICATHGALSTVSYDNLHLPLVQEKFKDFLYMYFVYNPNFPDLSMKILEKYLNDNIVVGIKIHPSWHFCYPNDKNYEKIWDFAEDRQIPVLTHSWNPDVPNKAQKFSDPFLFEEIVKKHPKLKLILAHAGGRGEMLFKVIQLLNAYENLYVDFAGDIFVPGLIEEYVEKIGSKRILFGSDIPWVDVRFQLINILNCNISDEDRKNILGLNAKEIFNLKF